MLTSQRQLWLGRGAAAVGAWLLLATASVVNADPPAALQNESGRGLALGTGMRSSAISTAALAYNPSSLPFGRLYHLEGNIDYSPNNDSLMFGSAIVDSLTSSVGAGLSARGILSQGNGAPDGFDLRLGMGLPLSDAISVGVSGRYLNITAPAALRDADNGDPDPTVKGLTLDAALGVHPSQSVHLSVQGYNLINRRSSYAPVMAGGSLSVNASDEFTIGGDVVLDFTSFGRTTFFAGGGMEYLHNNSIPLRLGYMFDSGRRFHIATAGVGYNDQQMGVELAVQQGVAGTNDTRLFAAVRYFVH